MMSLVLSAALSTRAAALPLVWEEPEPALGAACRVRFTLRAAKVFALAAR